MSDKQARYNALVQARKECRECSALGLTNPSVCDGGEFDRDCNHVGAWSIWQGNLDASLMVVGQDWGDVSWHIRAKGYPTDTSTTNTTLLKLLRSIGFDKLELPGKTRTPDLFFTNAILCLKEGGAQSDIRPECFRNCGKRFLRPTIELVQPKVVVCLGAGAYRAVLGAWKIKARKLNDAVTDKQPVALSPSGPWVFAVYHCGARTLNTNRNLAAQMADWKRIGEFVPPASARQSSI